MFRLFFVLALGFFLASTFGISQVKPTSQVQRRVSPSCPVSGVPGVPGVPGLNGRDGTKGDQGPKGPTGKKGMRGTQGPQGDKGEQGPSGVVPQKNWKQCVWDTLNDGRDYGLIKDCVFVKKDNKTALKVEFDGDFRIAGCLSCCKRWFFTFNGAECSKPITIEGLDAIHTNHGRKDTNVHKHSQIGGYCEGIGKGNIRVGLVVGDCRGFKSGGDAYTGWQSVARIVIEEVPPPQ